MKNVDSAVTRQERIAAAKKIGIAKPVPFYVPAIALLLTIALVAVALTYSLVWLMYAAIVPELATLMTAIAARGDYALLNGHVVDARERHGQNVAKWDALVATLNPPVKASV